MIDPGHRSDAVFCQSLCYVCKGPWAGEDCLGEGRGSCPCDVFVFAREERGRGSGPEVSTWRVGLSRRVMSVSASQEEGK